MTNPVKPAIVINSISIPSPSEIKWNVPESFGYDGMGKERIFPYYSAELSWNYMKHDEYQTLHRVWLGQATSGYFSNIDLPSLYNNDDYQYVTYSGVLIDPPRINGPYLQNYLSDIRMKVRRLSVD